MPSSGISVSYGSFIPVFLKESSYCTSSVLGETEVGQEKE